jgi:16S rRNA (adenine1518-N6/adenine1519-N6)-dimethyltransferase
LILPALGAGRVRDVLERHGVRPSKALGQNFVIDPNTVRKVVMTAALDGSERVLEIGAGVGSLTVALAAAAAHVVALEVDPELVGVLEETLAGHANVELIQADALDEDLGAFGATALVANLPYNIATPLVLRALAEAPDLAVLTVMTQREVGERLAARPGSKAYGQASVVVAYYATARVAARVSRRAFYPTPRVDSVIARIARRDRTVEVALEDLRPIVRAAFSQRRKTLRNALRPVAGSAEAAEEALRRAGLDPRARAEEVDLEGFEALAQALKTSS